MKNEDIRAILNVKNHNASPYDFLSSFIASSLPVNP